MLAVLVVVATLPFLFKKIWQTELSDTETLPRHPIEHRRTLGLGLVIVLLVLVFFTLSSQAALRYFLEVA